MAATRKYPEELRRRATRMAVDARKDSESKAGAIRRVAEQLGVHPEALRTWVKRAETDEGLRPGSTSEDEMRIAGLEREVRELRRANQILRSASAFFAAELERVTLMATIPLSGRRRRLRII
ncbi:transposase [Spelaeicoccus albus]|uniref:Transposase n=1 Tax=Spelaeicoccus albus TaxID=1280376 RepID=A0A7Z0A9S1_9MICO|nr:transposase [Spelaeicoccus albus]NYI67019.1 transposase [Spelaeicoccus albus]